MNAEDSVPLVRQQCSAARPLSGSLPIAAPIFAPLAAEIRCSVRLALDTLERVANETAALESVKPVSTLFHQVGAALKLAGIDGVPALTELLQRVLASVSSGSLPLTATLAMAVRRCCNALLAYLDALMRGQPVPSLSLFPAYRSLYALQGSVDVTPAALLSLRTVSSVPIQIEADCFLSQPVCTIDNLREQYEQALLDYLRSSDADVIRQAAQQMFDVISSVVQRQRNAADLLHWQVLQAFAELIVAGTQPAAAKKILAGAGRLVRHLEDEADCRIAPQLVREALFEIACAGIATPLSTSVVAAYNLNWQIPVGYDSEQIPLPAQEAGQADAWMLFAVALAEAKDALENSAADTLLATSPVPAAMHALASQAVSIPALAGLTPCLQCLAEHSTAAGLQRQHAVPLAACLLLIEQGLQEPEQLENWYACNEAVMQAMLDCFMQTADVQRATTALPCLPESGQRQSVSSVLTATISETLQTLALLESRIDAALHETSMSSAWPAMDGMLGQVGGALSLLNKLQAVEQVRELRDMLAAVAADHHGADRAASTAVLADRFAILVQQITMLNFQSDSTEEHAALTAVAQESVAEQDEMDCVAAAGEINETAVADEKDDTKKKDTGNILMLSPVLHAIYLEEAQQCIAHISQSVREWCANPEPSLLLAAEHALHALAGSSAAVSLHAVHELATTLESLLQECVLTRTQLLAPAEQAVLLEAVDMLEQMLAQLLTDQLPACQPGLQQQLLSLLQQRQLCALEPAEMEAAQPVPASDVTQPLPDTAVAVADTIADAEMQTLPLLTETSVQPAISVVEDAAGGEQADPELLCLFIEEATDLLSQIDHLLQTWNAAHETEAEAPSPAPALLRILHTLKGSARMAGAAALGEQLHQMEHALAHAEPVPVASLLADFECIMQLFAQLLPPVPNRVTADKHKQGATPHAQQPASQVQLRVRTDLLGRVANSAAELVVGGARVSGELQQQRHALADLNDNLMRLRSQLREVEIQAETQIASGGALNMQREFDPLEFDRFTSLQELTRMMAETVADIASVQRMLSRHVDGAALAMTAQQRYARTLQHDFRRVRIVQFSSIAERLQLLVRQVAHELERNVRLELRGGSIEIDRSMLDKINAPLEHLLRNAIAHGIELPQERVAAGKPAAGTIQIELAQHGNDIVLQLSDDGRGLDGERIRKQATIAGLIAADANLTDAETANLIFEPGLTTSDAVTALSGRGIGMDAVRANLLAQGGSIKVSTTSGRGTCFTLVLPLTLATIQVLLATAGGMQVAIPSSMVAHVLQLPAAQIRQAYQAGALEWRGDHLRLHNLASLLALEQGSSGADKQPVPVVILRHLDGLQAVELDAVAGNREVVVKNIGSQLAQVAGIAGATVLADASIVLIINPLPLIESALRHERAGMAIPLPTTKLTGKELPLVLIVDDSLTVRRISQRLLDKHGYATLLARDGFDALEKLANLNGSVPAAMLFDIEMPRMDGFDLLSHVRQDPRLSSIPIVMISSRTASRHREHAMALGATAYLGKPFQETALLSLLAELCANSTESSV